MTLDEYTALPWREQNAYLEPFLQDVLRQAHKPLETITVAFQIGQATNLPEKIVAHALTARFGPNFDYARQREPVANAMGKLVRRWSWYPLGTCPPRSTTAAPVPLEDQPQFATFEGRLAALEAQVAELRSLIQLAL